jgi:hypothetical protein
MRFAFCSYKPGFKFGFAFDSRLVVRMPAARKRERQLQRKTFHATMLVTRAEEWWVEAESLEKAQALLAAGQAQRNTLGELVHFEIDVLHAPESEE